MDDEFYEDDFPEANNTNTQSFIKLSKLTSGIFLAICCMVGLYGNIMSIAIFSHSSMRSSINFLLASLSFIDAVLLISVSFVLVLSNLNVAYPTNTITRLYPYFILIVYPISCMTQTCSVWTFVLVSIERYIAICHPLKRHKLMTLNEARFAQCIVLLCGILYNSVRFWEYDFAAVESSNDNASPSATTFELTAYLRSNSYYFLIYSTSLHLCTHFLVPFLVILAAHWSVFRSLEKARKQIRDARRTGSQNRGTTFMIMTMTLGFVLFNILPMVGHLWEALDPDLYDGPWMKTASTMGEIGNCLSVLNSSCTFIIYLVYCKKYRHLFSKYWRFDPVPDGSPVSLNESLSTAWV